MIGSEYNQPSGSTLLLAAHPDDEIIGAGGWTARQAAGVTVAFLTDGVPRDPQYFAPGYADPAHYRETRRREAEAVWRSHPARPKLYFAPFADQDLFHVLDQAGRWLDALLQALRVERVLAPAFEGGHPDHDAANFLAATASCRFSLVVSEYALYHAAARGMVRQQFGNAPATVLSPPEADWKRQAMAKYASQARVLREFSAWHEAMRPLPRHQYAQPPGAEATLYERWGWSMSAREVAGAFARHSQPGRAPCAS